MKTCSFSCSSSSCFLKSSLLSVDFFSISLQSYLNTVHEIINLYRSDEYDQVFENCIWYEENSEKYLRTEYLKKIRKLLAWQVPEN